MKERGKILLFTDVLIVYAEVSKTRKKQLKNEYPYQEILSKRPVTNQIYKNQLVLCTQAIINLKISFKRPTHNEMNKLPRNTFNTKCLRLTGRKLQNLLQI